MPPLNQFQKTVIALAVGHALLPSNLQAATITVDTSSISSNAGDCDIYDAFDAANSDTVVAGCVAGDPGSDTVVLPDDAYITLNSSVNSNEVGLLVSTEITLQGNRSRIRGSGEKRLIDVLATGSLAINNADMRYGRLTSNDVGGGAAVRVTQGTLSISDSTLRGSSVTTNGGSIKHGGAILAYASSVSLTGVYASNNRSSSTLTDSRPYGGFLRAEAGSTITINESYLRSNYARQGYGGAISGLNSQITIDDSILRRNSAGEKGGAIHSKYGNVSVASTLFKTNRGGEFSETGEGGAIAITGATLSVSAQSNFSQNSSGYRGSAISVYGDGAVLNMRDSFVYNNRLYSPGDSVISKGGAISIDADNSSDFSTITNSTVSENFANQAQNILISGGELGIYNSTIIASGGEYFGGGPIDIRAKENTGGTALFAENNSIVKISNSVFTQSRDIEPLINIMPGSLCEISATAVLNRNTNNHFADDSCDGVNDGDPLLSRRTKINSEERIEVSVGRLNSEGEADRTIILPSKYYGYIPRFDSPLINAGDITVCSGDIVGGEDARSLPHAGPASACDIGAIDSREVVILVDSKEDGVPDDLAVCTLHDALINAQQGGELIRFPNPVSAQNMPRTGSTCEISYDQTIIRFDPAVFPTSASHELQLQPGPFGELPQINGLVSIQGPGQTVLEIKGGGATGILRSKYASLDISDLTISGGQGDGGEGDGGGAIYSRSTDLTLDRVTVTKNSAIFDSGGAITLSRLTSATFTDSTISDSYTGGEGGGVYIARQSALVLNRTTITGNSAMGFNSSEGRGGGLYVGGESKLTMVNSTVSGNSATLGGGVFFESSEADVLHSTITDNMSTSYGAGLYIVEDRKYNRDINFVSSILAGNKSMANLGNELVIQDDGNSPVDPRLNITFEQSLFGSAESDYSQALINLNPSAAQVIFSPGSIVATSLDAGGGANPNSTAIAQILRPLSGSLLKVHELVSGSPAIDAGAIMGECRVATDQLGRARGGETCDMGATEILVNDDVFFIIRAANGNVIAIPL